MNNREIDRVVEEKIMGAVWRRVYSDRWMRYNEGHRYLSNDPDNTDPLATGDEPLIPGYYIRPYSTDIAAAWQVVEKMDKGFVFSLYSPDPYLEDEERKWEARFIRRANRIVYYKEASTALIAICLAALKAVGVEMEANDATY